MRIKLTEKSINKAPPATGVLELWDSVLPGFGLRIYKSGRRRYFVMTRFAGQQIRRTIGAPEVLKLAEARDAARDVLKLIAKGVDPREADRLAKIEAARARSNSVRSVVEAYLDDRGKGGGFNLRSKHSLKQRLENHVLGAWGDRPITEITRVDVRQLVEGIARKHPIAANRVLAAVRRVFNWAVSKDRADASPCVGIEAPGVERKRERTLTDDEIRLVWQGAGQLGKISGGVVKMLLLTAARRAEIGGMKRHELVNGTWTLPASRSKNGRANALPLPDLAKNILADVPVLTDDDGKAYEFVFSTGRRGDRPYSGWTALKVRLDGKIAKLIADAAGEKVDAKKHRLPDWTLHALRKTLRTRMPDLGITPDIGERVLGHALPGIRGIYDLNDYNTQKAHALTAWAAHVEAIASDKPADDKVVTFRKRKRRA